MRKSMLYTGIGMLICGIALISLGEFSPDLSFNFRSLIIGFASPLIVPGIFMIYKYLHWTKPQNVQIYEAKMKEEQINLKDERKIMLRDKSGHISYIIMICLLFLVNLIFTIMRVDKLVSLVLWVLLGFQYICGIFVFRYLDKKL